MTIAVFHIQNDIAKKPERSRKLFLEFLVKCVRHKVDFIFGDGNMAANSCGTNQAYADRANSTLAKALRQTQLVFNSQREVWDRLSVQVIETESAKTLAAFKSPMRSDLDSMVAWTLGWAASPLAAYRRDQLSRLVQEIRLSESTDDLTEEEVALLDATEISKPLMQFNDWNVKVSEHAKHITNEDLFFESGAGGWHKPLYTTLRCGEVPNNRKRKANPYRTYKQELSIAAFLSLITVSDASALTDVGTCSTKAELEEDGISIMFILLLASVMVHLYFILRWTFSYLSDRLCVRRFGDEVIDHATCMCCERPTGRSVKNMRQCSVRWCRHRCCDECSGNRARPFVCPCHDYQGAPAYYLRDASASAENNRASDPIGALATAAMQASDDELPAAPVATDTSIQTQLTMAPLDPADPIMRVVTASMNVHAGPQMENYALPTPDTRIRFNRNSIARPNKKFHFHPRCQFWTHPDNLEMGPCQHCLNQRNR